MPGVRPVFEKGPLTFNATVAANGGNIRGGTFVEPDGTTGKIKPAVAGSAKVLGLALGDVTASDWVNAEATDTWGNPVVNGGLNPPNEVAVAYQGVFRITAGAAIAFGDLVEVAGTGADAGRRVITKNTGATVGRCVEPGGIASGAQGKILLHGLGV